MKFFLRTSGLPLVLIPSLVISPVWAQVPLPVPNQASLATNLVLRIVENGAPQAAGNFTPSKRIAVQVRDENGAPVGDAAVAFRLPDAPLSGNFADGSHSAVAYTDQSGVAHVDGIQWIASTGSVPVRITATKGNSHAGLLFEDKMSDVSTEVATASRSMDVALKPAPLPNGPVTPAPGVVASDVAKVQSPAAVSGEVATAAAAPRPSVSIANFSHSGTVRANSLRSDAEPSVSISNSGGYSNHSSLKKWLIWGAVLAGGAGAAFAFSGKGGSASSTTSTSTTTVGTPTINIGH